VEIDACCGMKNMSRSTPSTMLRYAFITASCDQDDALPGVPRRDGPDRLNRAVPELLGRLKGPNRIPARVVHEPDAHLGNQLLVVAFFGSEVGVAGYAGELWSPDHRHILCGSYHGCCFQRGPGRRRVDRIDLFCPKPHGQPHRLAAAALGQRGICIAGLDRGAEVRLGVADQYDFRRVRAVQEKHLVERIRRCGQDCDRRFGAADCCRGVTDHR
jgi:hypothetical protein